MDDGAARSGSGRARLGDPRLACGVAWLALAALAPWHTMADSRSGAVGAALIAWGWLGWTAVSTALLVGTPVALTVVRTIAPLALIISVAARSPWSMAATVLVLGASSMPLFADRMVRGGAYGRETRFTLRTPVPHMAPAVVAWVVQVVTLIGGSMVLAAGNVAVGSPLLVAGIVLATRTPRHLHRLSRRWLVVVPTGIVVHDHMVLGETLMVRSSRITSKSIVSESGEAADLTGGVVGERLLVVMDEAEKVVLSPITAGVLGTTEALHVLSFTVAPRRPRAVLAELAR